MIKLFILLMSVNTVFSQSMDVYYRFDRGEGLNALKIYRRDSLLLQTGNVWTLKNCNVYDVSLDTNEINIKEINLLTGSVWKKNVSFQAPDNHAQIEGFDVKMDDSVSYIALNQEYSDCSLYKIAFYSKPVVNLLKRTDSPIHEVLAVKNGVVFTDFFSNIYYFSGKSVVDSMRLAHPASMFRKNDSTLMLISYNDILQIDIRKWKTISEIKHNEGLFLSPNSKSNNRLFYGKTNEIQKKIISCLGYFDFEREVFEKEQIVIENGVITEFFVDKDNLLHVYYYKTNYPYDSKKFKSPEIFCHDVYDARTLIYLRSEDNLSKTGWYKFW